MKKVIVLTEKSGTREFETMKDMFQKLSEEGVIISSVEDGVIHTKEEEKTFAMVITETEGTKEALAEEVNTYRDELRASITLLKKQGLEVSKTEMAKLAKQFEFLNPPKEEAKAE